MPFIIPNQTSYVLERPTYTGTTWTRPADWITITDTTGEVQFLVSDLAIPTYRINTTYTRTLGTQRIYIDWGDGTIDTISAITASDTSHTYTSGGTPCSLGYNTWKVRIYGDAGTRITSAYPLVPAPFFNTPNTAFGGTILQVPSGLLEAYYGDTTILSAQFLFSYSTARPIFRYLNYCKLPSVMTGSGNILENAFGSCFNLYKVDLPTSMPNNTSTLDLFASCISLQSVVFPQDMINLTNMGGTFSNCNSLVSIKLPPTLNLVTAINSCFTGCFNLKDINFLPALPLCINYASAFQNCRSLITAQIKTFRQSVSAIDFSFCFNNCRSLEYVNLPPLFPGSTIVFNGVFGICGNLKSFIAPTNFNATTMNNCFNSCVSLSSCILPTSQPSLTDMGDCFNGCVALPSVSIPSSPTLFIQGAFTNCLTISEITIPSGTTLTSSLLNTFNGCANLRKITLPALTGATLINMNTAFATCSNLQQLIIPSFGSQITQMNGVFQSTSQLDSFIFPSATTFNLVSTIATMFQSSGVKSVSFPSSMSSLTAVNSVFFSTQNIENVVLPTTTGNITTYASSFLNAISLQSVSFPTTQSTALTTMNGMFQNAYSLTGLTNTQFLGNPSTAAGNTTYVDGTNAFVGAYLLPTIDLYCKFSKFAANGVSTLKTALTSLRLRNNGAGQYGGTSPQIDISYTNLGQAALVQVFNDLPTITSKTINITGASGAAALTAPERAIATGKGWTITG